MIYFKGYHVPGTPELTKRYFPEAVLGWFGKVDAPEETDPATALDIEALFIEHGLLEECEEVDDICVSELFEERWQQARCRLNDPEAMLQKTIAVDPSTTEFGSDGDGLHLGFRWSGRPGNSSSAAESAEVSVLHGAIVR